MFPLSKQFAYLYMCVDIYFFLYPVTMMSAERLLVAKKAISGCCSRIDAITAYIHVYALTDQIKRQLKAVLLEFSIIELS